MAEKLIYTPHKTGETVLHTKERVSYLTFQALDAFEGRLLHAFSTRKGGFSKGIYKSMNLGFSGTDSLDTILFNYRAFTKALGIRYRNLVIAQQQHTANLRIVTKADRGMGLIRDRDFEAIDGFVTNEPGVGLCLLFADCVPVYLYDPETEAIGLVHSGWKGTAGQIAQKAVELMQNTYGSRPENVIACIGPSICQDCYEVTGDLREAFSGVYSENELAGLFAPGKDSSHFQLSLWNAIQITLQRAGVAASHIHVTDLCTCHNPDLLFSHRFTQGKRGNLAAVMMLLPEPPEDPELLKNLLPSFPSRKSDIGLQKPLSHAKISVNQYERLQ